MSDVKMKLRFERKPTAPESLIANVVIENCPIPGVEMREVGVWAGRDGKDDYVTFNGRQFTDQSGKKKSVKFLGPMGGDWTAYNRFTTAIVAAALAWAKDHVSGPDGESYDEGDGEENPFA